MNSNDIDRDVHDAQRLIFQFWDFAQLCYCGSPEIMLNQIRALLDRVSLEEYPGRSWHDTYCWQLNCLSAWGLIDHGTSLYGSWLTDSGRRLLGALKTVNLSTTLDDDWDDNEVALYPPNGRARKGENFHGTWEA